ncbi:hypothetical protein HOY80DRAFT_988083 [Tuber brumale]|nr:hypothetical protein HOY80DRAFT_988083 [Tuber brumale]
MSCPCTDQLHNYITNLCPSLYLHLLAFLTPLVHPSEQYRTHFLVFCNRGVLGYQFLFLTNSPWSITTILFVFVYIFVYCFLSFLCGSSFEVFFFYISVARAVRFGLVARLFYSVGGGVGGLGCAYMMFMNG